MFRSVSVDLPPRSCRTGKRHIAGGYACIQTPQATSALPSRGLPLFHPFAAVHFRNTASMTAMRSSHKLRAVT